MSSQDQDGYTEEQRQAAYYTQQGYTPEQVVAAMGTESSSSANTSYADYTSTSYSGPQPTTGPYPASTSYQPLLDSDMLQQSSVYTPQGAAEASRHAPRPGKRETVIRKGSGKVWEDPTLLDWDPKWFRLFVGDVSNDVNERTLDEAFSKYSSYCKCKVVRDRLSLKAKYGFIAFKDPEDFLKAWKEMDGKYVGNRPIRLSKVRDDKYGSIRTVEISGKKAKALDKIRKNHGKPLNGRPVPF
ncbi:hypothetical protein L204_102164 [Cryptococcus depauperatus]|nr:RNA recognition domain-containing protein (RRM)-containing protein [Cryptococcus depauperatus CBS 7855]